MTNQNKRGLAAAYRKNQAETVELPSGSVAMLRRPPIQIWASTGRFPQVLLAAAMQALDKDGDFQTRQAQIASSLAADAAENQFAVLKFMVDVVQYAFVEPKLVEGATGDDELDPTEVTPEDFNFVFSWACRGNKDQVVGKNNLTVGAVENFRDSGSDQAVADVGGDVPVVSDTPTV